MELFSSSSEEEETIATPLLNFLEEINFTKQLYFAGLDDNQKPNGDVRVYGTWEALNSVTKKPVLMDYYAVLFFNDGTGSLSVS